MKKLFSSNSLNNDIGVLLLRLSFGGLFTYFGYSKFAAYDAVLPMFADIGNTVGLGATWSLNLVIFAEFFCGILVTLGILTRAAIIPIFITMTVAYFIAHAQDPFQNKVLPLLFWFLCFVIFVTGAGKYSLDYLMPWGKTNTEKP
ncbi:MAG TPA: DoxX family protein [Ohtaekwangia sp.]|nr:DoxX family protein [Ohtaekwangia sp.]